MKSRATRARPNPRGSSRSTSRRKGCRRQRRLKRRLHIGLVDRPNVASRWSSLNPSDRVANVDAPGANHPGIQAPETQAFALRRIYEAHGISTEPFDEFRAA